MKVVKKKEKSRLEEDLIDVEVTECNLPPTVDPSEGNSIAKHRDAGYKTE